jgi:hypothetical protein
MRRESAAEKFTRSVGKLNPLGARSDALPNLGDQLDALRDWQIKGVGSRDLHGRNLTQ